MNKWKKLNELTGQHNTCEAFLLTDRKKKPT